MRDTLAKDIEMLTFLAISTKQAVATKYKLTMGALDSWLHRIRERRREARQYINSILAVENRNPRLRKTLLSAREGEELITDLLNLE